MLDCWKGNGLLVLSILHSDMSPSTSSTASSDEIGGAPQDRPVSPAEVAATIYRGLGIQLDLLLPGPQSRPIRLVDNGVEPITELV